MNIWVVLISGGLITYAIRLSFIVLLERWHMPVIVQRALRFVPPAVLSAIILPELLMQEGQVVIGLENPRLIAGIAAAVVAWKTKNALLTVGVGMAVLLIAGWW
ncbi:MAG TPA: AzlD domain-containing protein [Levilinea sp.]|nr:AzlD domain-containing protein [Levilinea sp.]